MISIVNVQVPSEYLFSFLKILSIQLLLYLKLEFRERETLKQY